ncbi:hypothetical protein V7079_27230 [Priestia megaterium]|uniref:hypothetical protein n=1 Tax=Priestia megaterium TaxID=1404 RepID=UPI000BF4A872|nr:hypothetical protein [Priestia megaterium]PFK01957.1 hypothetical protein COI96_06070 [Priestia megaterium]PMD08176.1 hypothetical protein CJ194_19460 [Priestia megaterium]
MSNTIKVSLQSSSQIIIEAPEEFGKKIYSLLLIKDYPFVDYGKIGKSTNPYVLNDPEIKHFSIMTFNLLDSQSISDVAELIRRDFNGELLRDGDDYVIALKENNSVST